MKRQMRTWWRAGGGGRASRGTRSAPPWGRTPAPGLHSGLSSGGKCNAKITAIGENRSRDGQAPVISKKRKVFVVFGCCKQNKVNP